jgi:hypothetical protein
LQAYQKQNQAGYFWLMIERRPSKGSPREDDNLF